MSRIKAWIHDHLEDEMFYNADMQHELEEAMRNEMDPPENNTPIDKSSISNNPDEKDLDTPF